MVARVFQGIAEGGEPILMMIGRDCYEKPEDRMGFMARFMSLLFLVPAVAPALGGAIANWVGWRASFFMLAGWGLANTFLVPYLLPETTPVDAPEDKSLEDYRSEFGRVIGNSHIMTLSCVAGIALLVIFVLDTNLSLILGDIFLQNPLQISIKLAALALVG